VLPASETPLIVAFKGVVPLTAQARGARDAMVGIVNKQTHISFPIVIPQDSEMTIEKTKAIRNNFQVKESYCGVKELPFARLI
jgi:hypothetical protein